jgi:hypothetical protein
MTLIMQALLAGAALMASAAPAFAQARPQEGQPTAQAGRASGAQQAPRRGRVQVQPYIEVNQILSAEITPGSDVVTYTQIAAGVDVNLQGRTSSAAVSLRYERNIGYDDNSIDSNTISGVARGSLGVVPGTLSLEAGALASRSRIDAGGGNTVNPLARDNNEARVYSAYAGPSLQTRVGDVGIQGVARVGYNRFEADTALVAPGGEPANLFDDSVTYTGQIRAGTRAGEVLPVGLAVTAGGFQEDISNLDQRVRDLYVRGDVTVPITQDLALVGGAGYENVEISSRDAVRDVNGNPVVGADGRYVTDSAAPRQIAFKVDGLLWDVGVLWRPSSRTSLQASVGRRYDSTTYYGTFTYAPSERSNLAINVYDGVSGFGGVLNNGLAGLGTDFQAIRNPVSGDFAGLVGGSQGQSLIGATGSARAAAFRGRGVRASYQRTVGRTTAAIGAGYDRRTFIAAEGTVLAPFNGVTDESYYLTGGLSRELGGGDSSITTNAYVNWFRGAGPNDDVTAIGGSAAFNKSITQRLQGRAAIGVDYVDSQFTAQDFAIATALVGLRYNF